MTMTPEQMRDVLMRAAQEATSKMNIPSPSPSSTPLPLCWQIFESVAGKCDRILLHGPPGTGKTTAGFHYGLKAEQKVFCTTLTDETPSAELRGHYTPKGGEFTFTHGVLISAWLCGGRAIINEINEASMDAATFLHAALDDKEIARITLPTNPPQDVMPHKDFDVIATMNGNPDELKTALRDRFSVCIHIDKIHPAALVGLSPAIQRAAQGSVGHEDPERRTSVRAWKEMDSLINKGVNPQHAAYAIFGKRAGDVLNAIKIAEGK